MALVKEIENFFANGNISPKLQNSQQSLKYQDTNNEILEEDREIFSSLPLELRILYSRVGSNHIYTYYNSYSFLTLDQIKQSKQRYKHFIDIAIAYRGMGWYDVISFCPEKNIYFLRHDGGSSGYDRENNYKTYKDYVPQDSEFKSIRKLLDFYLFEYESMQ